MCLRGTTRTWTGAWGLMSRKSDHFVVFVNDVAGDLFGNDATEDAALQRPHPLHRHCCMMNLKNSSLERVLRSWSINRSVAVKGSTCERVRRNRQMASFSASV